MPLGDELAPDGPFAHGKYVLDQSPTRSVLVLVVRRLRRVLQTR